MLINNLEGIYESRVGQISHQLIALKVPDLLTVFGTRLNPQRGEPLLPAIVQHLCGDEFETCELLARTVVGFSIYCAQYCTG